MKGINKAILIGYAGREPDIRTMPNGTLVAKFSIATSYSIKNKAGAYENKTEWHNVIMYNKLAEAAKNYLKKGSKVYVEGMLRTRKYLKDNIEKSITEIVAGLMQILDKIESKPEVSMATSSVSCQQELMMDDFEDKTIPF